MSGAAAEAFTIAQTFPAAPRSLFMMDRHYLLYARAGTVTLEADGRSWTLPPARAAVIPANWPVHVTLPRPVEACSVLFDASVFPAPAPAPTVLDMSPLARELIHVCGNWTSRDVPLDAYGRQIFSTLVMVIGCLAQRPSPISMPVGRSREVVEAIGLAENDLADPPGFDTLAASVGSSRRSLARKLSSELGLTWRQTLQRLRVIQAVTLLSDNNASVSRVAFDVGYELLSAFNAAFRELVGTTPTQYRRTIRQASYLGMR